MAGVNLQALFTAIVLIISIGMIASGRFPIDWVALGTLAALYLGGVLDTDEALSGFSASATVTLAGIYVVSGGLKRSGAIALIGQWLLDKGGQSSKRLSGLLFIITSLFSAFMSNLATMVIVLPLGYRLSRASKTPLGKLLLPIGSFAALGGYLTLLGTPSNLIVADILAQETGVQLGLFAPTIIGLPVLIFSLIWVLGVAQKLLPATGERPVRIGPNLQELGKTYKVDDMFYRLRVRSGSDLVGRRLRQLGLRERWGVTVVGVARPDGAPFRPWPDLILEENDALIMQGNRADILQLASLHHLEPKGTVSLVDLARLAPAEMELAEVLIPPYSSLVGKTLEELQFGKRYGLTALALLREGEATAQGLRTIPLRAGDRLLVEGSPRQIQTLRKDTDLIVLSQLGVKPEDVIGKRSRIMLLILAGIIILSVSPWISIPMAAIIGALATVILGAVTPREAYDDVDWSIVIFIAALLPLGTAMDNSGLSQMLGTFFMDLLGGLSPYALLAALFTFSVLLTQLLSNSMLALVLTPIAIFISQNMGLRPEPFVMAIMAGVSTSFLTPITDVICLSLRGPGKYRFSDYLKVNLPPVLFIGLSVVFLTPLIWPI